MHPTHPHKFKRQLGCKKGESSRPWIPICKGKWNNAEKKTRWEETFPGEVEGRVRSCEGAFYFLSNKSVEGIAKSQSEWAHEFTSECGLNGCVIFYPHGWEQEKKKSISVNFIWSICGPRTSGMILAGTNWLCCCRFFVCSGLKRNLLAKKLQRG